MLGGFSQGAFSQGGTTEIAQAFRAPERVKAVLNFAGYLASSVTLPAGVAGPRAAPIFWGHGIIRQIVPFRLAVSGRAAVGAAGVHVEARDHRIGHWMAEDEVLDSVTMVLGTERSGGQRGDA